MGPGTSRGGGRNQSATPFVPQNSRGGGGGGRNQSAAPFVPRAQVQGPSVLFPVLKLIAWRSQYKKDPLVLSFFDAHLTPSTLPSLLGTPLTLYLGTTKSQSPALHLSLEQANQLKSALVTSCNLNPSLLKTPFKADYLKPLTYFTSLTSLAFPTGAAIALRLLELKSQADESVLLQFRAELEATRCVFEVMRAGVDVAGKKGGGGAWFAIDFETWERGHEDITEVGGSYVLFRGGGLRGRDGLAETVREDSHMIVQENARKRNGRFVPDARDHFDFGTSLTLPTTSLVARLRTHITALSSYHPLILLCHDPRSDLVALQLLGIETSGFKRGMEDLWRSIITEGGLWPNGVWVVDTQVLYSGWMNDKRQVKLETCCAVLQLPTRRLHNAGNDAVYTLELLYALMDRNRLPPPNGLAPPAPYVISAPLQQAPIDDAGWW